MDGNFLTFNETKIITTARSKMLLDERRSVTVWMVRKSPQVMASISVFAAQ